jgi:hypothetical protein
MTLTHQRPTVTKAAAQVPETEPVISREHSQEAATPSQPDKDKAQEQKTYLQEEIRRHKREVMRHQQEASRHQMEVAAASDKLAKLGSEAVPASDVTGLGE